VWWREAVNALEDGAYWAWLVAAVAAVTVWVARGIPSPATAAAASVLMPIGAGAAAWRAWRRYTRNDGVEQRTIARAAFRRWLTLYATAAAVIPAVMVGAWLPVALALGALVELAIVTIPVRARRRLLARLRIGAAAVAGEEEVEVGRALWSAQLLDQVHITYPLDWAVQRQTKREDLVERVVWELCGPPPRTPAEAIARPDYITVFNHVYARLEVQRVPSLPRRLPARDFGQADGAGIVAGQTLAELADQVVDDVPVALYKPVNHALIVGGTQFGKSSGVRAWAVDGLMHGVFPGGLWAVDGKGSGSLAPLIGRRGVHAVGHTPEEWREIITAVAAEVARRYQEMLDWRSGRATFKPVHLLALFVIDEIQQILLACPDLAGVIDTLARQALESGVILWAITQRPDAKDAVPGAMRDQLLDRIAFGPLSSAGAKMAFDISGDDWQRALGVAPTPGRALTWTGGHWRPVQAPWLPIVADDPTVEPLYPQRTSQGPAGPTPQPAPRPNAPQDRPDSRQKDESAQPATSGETPPPIPEVEQILRDYDDPPYTAKTKTYDPTDPYANRRRRRRRD
jgi:hypothetical protein